MIPLLTCGSIGYWAFFGTMFLIIMTYQDFKHNKEIDERYNYIMYGLSLSLLSHFSRPFWYILVVLLVIIILSYILKKYDIVGEGDIQSFGWIIYGFALIHFSVLVWFFIYFIIINVVYYTLKLKVFNIRKRTPYYIIILLVYFLPALHMELFGM